jgi:nitrite reductase/ring-hydroxylating ferredoxin subunit
MDGSQTLDHHGRADRFPGDSYEDILERDSRPVPAHLRQGRLPNIGTEPVLASRYTSRAFFDKELRYLWPKIWQFACRVEDIANPGDYHIYENVGKSLIVTRTASGEIKAFYNTCLHRGRKLVTLNGCKSEFRCPYHGIAWNTDGSFKDNPIGWDFPQWEGRDMSLPQAKVETWGGFVFINQDLDAPSLIEQIKPLADDFARYDWENRYRALWIRKKVRCNWKAMTEAFMESHHSITTHPQILPGIADVNSQYDILNDYVSRQFSAQGVPSPLLSDVSEQDVVDYMVGMGGGRRTRPLAGAGEVHKLPEGTTARVYMAELGRQGLTQETGYDYSDASDAEMLDALLYNVFPNMSIWAGPAGKLTYRWRPNGLDVDSGIMDIMIFAPCPKEGPRPPGVPVIELDFADPVSSIPGLGGLAGVFDQAFSNLPFVQEGLHATGNGQVHFSQYTESRIRHLHHMIDRYIAEGEAKSNA